MLDFKINNATKKKIDFVGSVPEKELINLYRNASLFIFPSFYEGFGLPPLEAMASGCPSLYRIREVYQKFVEMLHTI